RRQLRRGARPRHERARLALDVVGALLERGARAHAAGCEDPDTGPVRARRHGHLSRRVPARARRIGGRRQDLWRAPPGRSLPAAGRCGGRASRRSAPARRRRVDPSLASAAMGLNRRTAIVAALVAVMVARRFLPARGVRPLLPTLVETVLLDDLSGLDGWTV